MPLCRGCKQQLPRDQFHPDPTRLMQTAAYCRGCTNAQRRKRRRLARLRKNPLCTAELLARVKARP